MLKGWNLPQNPVSDLKGRLSERQVFSPHQRHRLHISEREQPARHGAAAADQAAPAAGVRTTGVLLKQYAKVCQRLHTYNLRYALYFFFPLPCDLLPEISHLWFLDLIQNCLDVKNRFHAIFNPHNVVILSFIFFHNGSLSAALKYHFIGKYPLLLQVSFFKNTGFLFLCWDILFCSGFSVRKIQHCCNFFSVKQWESSD